MTKSDTQLLKDVVPLVVVVGGGYLLVKSGILSRVSEGVGSASQGVGEGLGELGQAVGGIGTETRKVFGTARRFIDTTGREAGEVVTAVGDVTEDVVRGGGRLFSAALNTPFQAFNFGVAIGDKLKKSIARGRKTASFTAATTSPLTVLTAAIKKARGRKTSTETQARAEIGAQKTTGESKNILRERLSTAKKIVSNAASKAKAAVKKAVTKKKRGRR